MRTRARRAITTTCFSGSVGLRACLFHAAAAAAASAALSKAVGCVSGAGAVRCQVRTMRIGRARRNTPGGAGGLLATSLAWTAVRRW